MFFKKIRIVLLSQNLQDIYSHCFNYLFHKLITLKSHMIQVVTSCEFKKT
jgi:hypothetical protein